MAASYAEVKEKQNLILQKISQNKTPALVERWIRESYQILCRCDALSLTESEKTSLLEDVLDNVRQSLKFYKENPKRCASFHDSAVNEVKKASYWLGKLFFVNAERESEEFEERMDSLADQLAVDINSEEITDSDLIMAMALGCHSEAFGFRALALFKVAKKLFKKGLKLNENKDYWRSKYCFEEAGRPIAEFKKCFSEVKPVRLRNNERALLETINGDVKELEEDVRIELTQASARLAIQNADNRHNQLMKENEFLNFEETFYIYDMYRNSLSEVIKNKDVELEAILYCRMGNYQLKVLKLPDSKEKAREFFRQVVEIGMALQPRNVSNEPWYKLAKDSLQELQKEAEKEAEKEKEDKKAKYKKELDEVKLFLERQDANAIAFVASFQAITEKYPPKTPFKESDFEKQTPTPKKQVLQAIQLYHPDKQPKNDELWKYTAEEITKFFNQTLAYVKGD